MRLLLDEMWSPQIAKQLRRRGHDVSAVTERPDLRGEPDGEILVIATAERRALVTDNVRDFRRLGSLTIQSGGSHGGLILTAHSRFPRHDPRTLGRMVAALAELLEADPDMTNVERWL